MNPLLSLSFLSPGASAAGAEAALNDVATPADNSHADDDFSRLLHLSGDQQTASRQSFAGFSVVNNTSQAARQDAAQMGHSEIHVTSLTTAETELDALDDTEAAALLGLLDQASYTRKQLAGQASEQARERGLVLAGVKVGVKGEWFILPVDPEPAELDTDGAQSSDGHIDLDPTAPPLSGQQRPDSSKAMTEAALSHILTEAEPVVVSNKTGADASVGNKVQVVAEHIAGSVQVLNPDTPKGDEKLAQSGSAGDKTQDVAALPSVAAAKADMSAQLPATEQEDATTKALAVDSMLQARQSTDMPERQVAGLRHSGEQAQQQVAVAATSRPAVTTLFDKVEARSAAKSGRDGLPASARANGATHADYASSKLQAAGEAVTSAAQTKQASAAQSEQSEPAAKIDTSTIAATARGEVAPTTLGNIFSVAGQVQADVVAARLDAATIAVAQQSAERAKTQSVVKTVTEQLKQVNLLEQNAAGQLKERINLMVRQNIQIADIRLDPADLGQMQIRVNLQHEQATVQFIVQQQHAKELLEQQMPRLREMLQQQGIQLGEGQVQQQRQGDSQGQAAGQHRHDQNGEAVTDEQATALQLEVKLSERLVDYYA